MTLPLVSILIPSYKSKYFEVALKSAIAQSYENIEIVVSDDCPDDSIYKIVDKYNKLKDIVYKKNPNPDGIGHNNITNCLKLARGEYVKFLFDDDVLMPFCVEYMVDAFSIKKDLNPRLVVSERWFIDSAHRYLKTNRLPVDSLSDITKFSDYRFMAINLKNMLGEFTTAMWRREDSFDKDGSPIFLTLNGQKVTALVDVAMWINLAKIGPVFYIPLPLSCFRIHNQSNSSSKMSDWYYTLCTDWEIVIEQAFAIGAIDHKELKNSFRKLLKLYKSRESTVPSLQGYSELLLNRMNCIR